MTLERGTRLGRYEIVELCGKGGMGEVYRARDSRLDRDVAIKVLPAELSEDATFRQRFEREAKTISQLQHPNVCTLHDVGSDVGVEYLVMEYLAGETLKDRIDRGPIAIDEVVRIGGEIADGVDAAHGKGIVHRDLKPGNVMLTGTGTKVLDFGLAREVAASGPVDSKVATVSAISKEGTIVGTMPYMAPEQLEGKRPDSRSDIWALGCVLYEMATGERPFRGETEASLIGAIMEANPLPHPRIAERLDSLLRRCLEKDPERRLQSARDLALELRAFEITDTAVAPQLRGHYLPAAALVAIALAAGVAWLTMRSGSPEAAPVSVSRLSLNPSPGESWVISPHDPDFAIAPDGERIAYIGRRGDETHLVVRRLDEFEGVSLGSFGGAIHYPFFSPDGDWVGFAAGNVLKKAAVDGSVTVTICALPGYMSGASWGTDNTIIVGTLTRGLYRVPSTGGEPEPLETRAFDEGGYARWPHILPGSQAVLFASIARNESEIRVRSLSSAEEEILVSGAEFPHYASTGHLLYVADGVLWAVGFDAEQLEITGDAVPVVDGVMLKGLRQTGMGAANVDISENGTLIYRPSGTGNDETSTLVLVHRGGREEPLDLGFETYGRPRLSPDGSRLAVEITGANLTNTDIWVGEVNGSGLRQLTFDPAPDRYAVWTRDGRRVVFHSERDGGGLFSKLADGTGTVERLLSDPGFMQLYFVTPDENDLVYFRSDPEPALVGLSLRPDSDGDARVLELEVGILAAISPDGRWLAFNSDETGDFEVYVQPYPNPDGAKWRVTFGGGRDPVWSHDGGELFYQNDTTMFALAVTTEPAFSTAPAVALFDGAYVDSLGRWYDVGPDGRFLMVKPGWLGDGRETPVIHVVLNWFEELKRLAPTD